MTLGTEWLIDASGCDAAALADLDRLRAVFNRVIHDLCAQWRSGNTRR